MYAVRSPKRVMEAVILQPIVVNQAFTPRMKAMYVPFHLGYVSLFCYKRLQSDRLKCLSMLF